MSNITEWVRPSEVITTGQHLMARTDNADAEPVLVEIIERRGEFAVLEISATLGTVSFTNVETFDPQCRFMFIPEVEE